MSDDFHSDQRSNPRNLRLAAKQKAPAQGRPVKKEKEKAESEALDTTGLGKVVIRNEFYRDGYRLALRVALVQSIAIIFLIGAMYYIISAHQPQDKYFATTVDGRVIPLVALDQPNLSDPALLSWVAQATTETMTFGFRDYKRRLQESSRHFTKAGWAEFAQELADIKLIENIEANYQLITAAPAAAPQIVEEKIVGGRYQWVVRIPLILSYQSRENTRTDNWDVTLVIVRVPRLESPNGVGIAQWIAAPGG